MRFKDYYATLGLTPDADAAAVRAAYRRLARRHHPDLNRASDASAQMSELNEAYEALSDPARRRVYDGVRARHGVNAYAELAADWRQGLDLDGEPALPTRDGGVSDFFAGLFGRGGKPERAEAPQRGADAHVKLAIKLADAYRGAQRGVTVRATSLDGDGHRVVGERKVQVQIPKGAQPGQHLRIKGQGSVGSGGGPPGDLYLELQFAPDARFRVDGRDVHGKVALAPWEAALGARIEVDTPIGAVEVTVPPDAQPGRKLRLQGLGLPVADGGSGAPGDFLLELRLALPPSSDPKARALYEAMAATLPDFKPRAAAAAGATA